MRVLILYTELAAYVIGNIRRFINSNPDAQFLIVHYPINPEAPFNFEAISNSQFIVFNENELGQIQNKINNFNADVLLCSGWSNKQYIQWVKSYSKSSKKVICFDNQWKGSFKQILLSAIAKLTFLKHFDCAWVAGEPQKEYALKLGFSAKNVFTGLYLADLDVFKAIGELKLKNRSKYPKVLISVARYIPQKDLPTLWNAFIQANQANGNHWKLQCIGLGDLYDQRIQNPFIEHLGFKQVNEIKEYILNAGVFVLPSLEEPWGVAVNEMALSALPLVLSKQVGAATQFLNPNNGRDFNAGNINELTNILNELMNLSDEDLWNMAEASFENALSAHRKDWNFVLNTINNDRN